MRLVCGVLVSMMGLPILTLQAADRDPPTITATGTATYYVTPTQARISFGIRVTDPTAEGVKEQLKNHEKELTAAIQKLKLESMEFVLAPQVLGQEKGNRIFGGVVGGGAAGGPPMPDKTFVGILPATVTVSAKDYASLTKMVNDVVRTAVASGSNCDGQPSTVNTDGIVNPFGEGVAGPRVELMGETLCEARNKAVESATELARKTAARSAHALELKLGEVISVTDESETTVWQKDTLAAALYGSGTDKFPVHGKREKQVRISVKFALVK